MTSFSFFVGIAVGMAIALLVIIPRVWKLESARKIERLRLDDFRQAVSDNSSAYFMIPSNRNGKEWSVIKCFYGSTGPINVLIREFDDEDEQFNIREAEELLSALKS